MNIKSNKFFISFVALLLVLATTANSYAYFQSTIGISSNDTQMDFITKTNYYPIEFRNGTTKLNAGTDKYLIESNTRNELIISGTTQPNSVDNMIIYLPVAFMAEASPDWNRQLDNSQNDEGADPYTGTYPSSENYLLTFTYENIGPDITFKSNYREVFGFTVSSNYMLKRSGSILPYNNNLVVANHGGASQWLQKNPRILNGGPQTIKLSFTWNVKAGVPELVFNFSNIPDNSEFKFKLSDFSIKKFAQPSTFTGNYAATLRSRILMWQDVYDYTGVDPANDAATWDAKRHPIYNNTTNGTRKFETEAWHTHIRYVDDKTISFGLPVSSLGVSSTSLIPLVYQSGVLQHAAKYNVSFKLTIEDPYFYGSGYTSASGSRFSDQGAYVSSILPTVVGQARNIDPSTDDTQNAHPYLYAPLNRHGTIEGNLSRSRTNSQADPLPSAVPYPIKSLFGHRYSKHLGNSSVTQITMRDDFNYTGESYYAFNTTAGEKLEKHESTHKLYFWAFNNNQTYGDVNGGHATASTNPWLVWEHGGSGQTWNCLPVVTFSDITVGVGN